MEHTLVFMLAILLVGGIVSATALSMDNKGISISDFSLEGLSLYAGSIYTENITITNSLDSNQTILIYMDIKATPVLYQSNNITAIIPAHSNITIPFTISIAHNSPKGYLIGNINFIGL